MKASDINHAVGIMYELCGLISGNPAFIPYTFIDNVPVKKEIIVKTIQGLLDLINKPRPVETEIEIESPNA